MRYILTAEGKIEHNAGTFAYQYFHKDHLGNTRVTYAQNGEITQAADYYPFGLRHEPMAMEYAGQKYLYNGKELQPELGWLDYGARMYDVSLGRWFVVDPLTEDAKNIATSPYVYCINNPILFIDPDGRNWFYYQAEGEDKKSWHWHKGDEVTYTNSKGKERTIRSSFEYLAVFMKTTMKDGTAYGSVIIYNQDKPVLFQKGESSIYQLPGFTTPASSGGAEGEKPIPDGNYTMDLTKRHKTITPILRKPWYALHPERVNGIQDLSKGFPYYDFKQDFDNDTRMKTCNRLLWGDWGNKGRIRFHETTSNGLLIDYNSNNGYYVHGKINATDKTHGCVCNKSDAVFNYFWNSTYRGIVPFWVVTK